MEPWSINCIINTSMKIDHLDREVKVILFISQFVFRLFHGLSRFLSKMFHVNQRF